MSTSQIRERRADDLEGAAAGLVAVRRIGTAEHKFGHGQSITAYCYVAPFGS